MVPLPSQSRRFVVSRGYKVVLEGPSWCKGVTVNTCKLTGPPRSSDVLELLTAADQSQLPLIMGSLNAYRGCKAVGARMCIWYDPAGPLTCRHVGAARLLAAASGCGAWGLPLCNGLQCGELQPVQLRLRPGVHNMQRWLLCLQVQLRCTGKSTNVPRLRWPRLCSWHMRRSAGDFGCIAELST